MPCPSSLTRTSPELVLSVSVPVALAEFVGLEHDQDSAAGGGRAEPGTRGVSIERGHPEHVSGSGAELHGSEVDRRWRAAGASRMAARSAARVIPGAYSRLNRNIRPRLFTNLDGVCLRRFESRRSHCLLARTAWHPCSREARRSSTKARSKAQTLSRTANGGRVMYLGHREVPEDDQVWELHLQPRRSPES